MCELSFHYANVTPEAVRSTYLAELFGFGTRRKTQGKLPGFLLVPLCQVPPNTRPTFARPVSVDPFSSLCIQVPAENLVRPASAEVRYFVVDVRPLVEYDSSHLASAWHLDGQLVGWNCCFAVRLHACVRVCLFVPLLHRNARSMICFPLPPNPPPIAKPRHTLPGRCS